jgi:signal peptidase I
VTSTRASRVRRALDVVFIALIGLVAALSIAGRVAPALGHPILVVAGGSMQPVFGIGSAIVLERVDPEALAVGDVVSLQTGPDRAVYTHRIVRVVSRDGVPWLETKGDANAVADPSLNPSSAVIGRVQVYLPIVGYLLAFLATPSGFLCVVALGGSLLVARSLLPSPSMRSRPAGVARHSIELA